MLMTDPQSPAMPGGGVDGRWLRAVQVPAARAFTRGYDRAATDGLLADCADVMDELDANLRFAHEEILTLRRQARTRAGRRARSAVGRARSVRIRRRPPLLRVG